MSRREPVNILLRRRAEDRHVAALTNLAENSKLCSIADFAARSDSKVKGALMRRKITEQNQRIRDQLDERRRKLALLLTTERAQYEREIEASFETPEQVKERMFAYARRLKEENEAERRKLAEELERKRFIQGSDVLRARASEITAERTALDRLAQLQEKQRLRRLEEEREAAEEAERRRAAARAFTRADVESEAKRRLAAEMRGALGAQVGVKKVLTDAEREYERRVDEAMLEEDRRAAEALRAADAGRKAAYRDEYLRTQRYNVGEAAVKAGAAAAEAAADRAELEAALRKEADAIAAERAAVEARKDETLAFRRQLADQMRKQAETTDWVDRHYAEEADKEWDKREAVWNADAEARRSLMSDVAATRLAQMEDKLRGKALEREREAAEAAAERAARDAAEARDRAKGDERRRLVAQQAEYTRAQLAERARAAEAEKQAEYLSWRLQQKEEREYAARVQTLLKDPATYRR